MSSIDVNPLVANIDITPVTTSFLWFIFASMITSGFGLLGLALYKPAGQRAFHHLAAVICLTASVAYFCMAADLGGTPIAVEYIRAGQLGQDFVDAGIAHPTRSVFYARYVDWVITTPLLLLELLLATGLPLSDLFTTLFLDEVMIVTGLIGALVSSSYKWGFFTFALFAQFFIWYYLLVPARVSAARLGPEFATAYYHSALFLSIMWIGYPVAWIVSEGLNIISPQGEMIFYGILDLISKPVFCLFHIWAMSKCDYARLGLSSGKYSETSTAAEHTYFNSAGVFSVDEKKVDVSPTSTQLAETAPTV